MRPTIDLPDELRRAARSLAHDRGQSLSQTISEYVRQGLSSYSGAERVTTDSTTGLPLARLGRPVTAEMVRVTLDGK
ncbi:MAG: CopG family transcriptional regulator [Candidatus Dormiibacterota bacterium]